METQTRLIRHYKFISAENITIFSVLSDDFLNAFFEVAEQQMWNYKLFKFTGEGRGGQNFRCWNY